MDGAPDPSLNHDGGPGDARCTLDHHPEPCDYKSTKYGDCTIYPPAGGVVTGELAQKFSDIDAKSDRMEGSIAKVEGSIGQLSSEIERVIKMLGNLTYKPPDPHASLAANTPAPPTAAPLGAPPVTGTENTLQTEAAAWPQEPALDQGNLATAATALISSNQKDGAAKTQVLGYTGQTMPEIRKDQDLASLVRTELGRILSETPSLQKAPDADISSNQARDKQQQSLREQQALVHQQLVQFQEAQQEQLRKFAAEQKVQLETFQQQLGLQIPKQSFHTPLQPASTHVFPTPQPPLQQAGGRDHPAYTALGGIQGQQSDQPQAGALAMDMETLLGLTVRSKQYRPFEFARRTQLFYSSTITEKNCNLPCYVLGYLRHCLILLSGVVPSTENEVSSRLTNLMNICEIAANNSTLSDFDCAGWQIWKAYGDSVFHDVETGRRSWEELPAHILPDIFLHAKDTVAMKTAKSSM